MKKYLLILILAITCRSDAQLFFGRMVSSTPPPVYTLGDANIVADGNSYFTNYGGTCAPSIMMTLSPFATNGATMQNFGVSAQQTSQMLGDVYSQVISTFKSGVMNIIIFQEGGNDIYYNGRVDSAIARVLRYCSIVRAAGFKIIVSTLIHRNQTTGFGDNPSQYNTKIDAYNSALIALTGVYDGCIRPDLESVFSTYGSGGYSGDEVHPNQTGHNKYADLYKTAILNL